MLTEQENEIPDVCYGLEHTFLITHNVSEFPGVNLS